MAKRTSEEVVEAPVEETEEVENGKDSVIVSWKGQSRVYSREIHGKDFKALAKEFAEKKGGKVA